MAALFEPRGFSVLDVENLRLHYAKTAGHWLARLGFDVEGMDKRVFPRDKVCAGWITPAVVSALERALLAMPWFARHVVVRRWFLRAGQPALI